MSVRKAQTTGLAVAKRARVEDEGEDHDPSITTLTVASSGEGQRKNALVRTIKRTSGLEAPIVSLAGAHGVRLPRVFVLSLIPGRNNSVQV